MSSPSSPSCSTSPPSLRRLSLPRHPFRTWTTAPGASLAIFSGVSSVLTIFTVVLIASNAPAPPSLLPHRFCHHASVNWQEAVQGWTALDSPTAPQLGPGWTMLDNSHIIMDCYEKLSSTVQYSSIWQASFNFNQLYHYH